jgi:hypothetical protein
MIISLIAGIGIIAGIICFMRFLLWGDCAWSGKLVAITYTEIMFGLVWLGLTYIIPDENIIKYVLLGGIIGWGMVIMEITNAWEECDVFVYSRLKREKFMAGLMIVVFNTATFIFVLDLLGG